MIKKSGFTLIELSIVLIIISLAVGSIVTGSSLIEANMVRNIINDMNMYQSSINLFKTQYNYLPGDLPGASNYFISSTTIFSGNGDGIITIGDEDLYAWQHLALAGYINGNYTGAPSTPYFKYNVNIPQAKIENTGFNFDNQANIYGNSNSISSLAFSSMNNWSNSQTLDGGAVPALTASKIDSKIDDGVPNTGKILGLRAYSQAANSVCTNQTYTTTPSGAVQYLKSDYTNPYCRLWYIY